MEKKKFTNCHSIMDNLNQHEMKIFRKNLQAQLSDTGRWTFDSAIMELLLKKGNFCMAKGANENVLKKIYVYTFCKKYFIIH